MTRYRTIPNWFLDDGDIKIAHGDALEQLAAMPAESVQCIVTSPPFWALRDYGTGRWEGGNADCDHLMSNRYSASSTLNAKVTDGSSESKRTPYRDVCGKCGARRVDGQIGLEATPDEWCARLVAVFRECRRVLRHDGVMWLEVGDTYARDAGPEKQQSVGRNNPYETTRLKSPPVGMKPKDLVGAPWLLAFALRADGWYLRSDTIWARPNPMPESVTDRPTKSHSYVFLMTKSARYYFDADAVREPAQPDSYRGRRLDTRGEQGYSASAIVNGSAAHSDHVGGYGAPEAGRNIRSVWSIATEPTPFAHFATFPQALVERCILAGTSERGACSACGSPRTRRFERSIEHTQRTHASTGPPNGVGRSQGAARARDGHVAGIPHVVTTGWAASCACHVDAKPCTILDPFMGSGTTALVARRLGRHAVGIELNADYLAIAAKRLQQLSLLGGAS